MVSPLKPPERRLIYVVEPHPIAAFHLAITLSRTSAAEVILSGVNLPADASFSDDPFVLIIDANALPFALAAFLRTARTVFHNARVLIIGNHLSDDELCRLLFHGASGFVGYQKVEEEICAAVDALTQGHLWFPPQLLERYVMLSSALEKQTRGDHGGLSPRETEVIGLLQRRLSNKEIGCALGISERTVRFHLQNIFEKLGVHDRHSALELAESVDPPQLPMELSVLKAA